MKILQCSALALLINLTTQSFAQAIPHDQPNKKMTPTAINVAMYVTTEHGLGQYVGSIAITKSPYGLIFTPNLNLQGILSINPHGFHIHTTPSCDMKGMAANGHFDPFHSNQHLGPYGLGHLGDLPALYVNKDGTSTIPLLAPRIKDLATVKNHALMIHEGNDNYSDQPNKLGGGGDRMICGVIST